MTDHLDAVADLDLRALRARIEREDGDLLLVLDDGDTAVRLNPGAGGSRVDAILGAERAANQLTQLAALLRASTIRRGSLALVQHPDDVSKGQSPSP